MSILLNGIILENTKAKFIVQIRFLIRMKSDNVPIKVECFCVGKTGREMIGFVVVPLRTVAILTGNKVLNVSLLM